MTRNKIFYQCNYDILLKSTSKEFISQYSPNFVVKSRILSNILKSKNRKGKKKT